MGLFDGMASLGFDDFDEIDIFKPPEKPGAKTSAAQPTDDPLYYLYEKEFTCPVCGGSFTNHVVRKSKLRLVNIETDLKANYEYIDPNRYDTILCRHCGYAALLSFFNKVSDRQVERLLEKIKPRFIPKDYPMPLSPEDAIERNKMALMCAVTKGVKYGEKAILCLKTAWLYRDIDDKNNERLFLSNAFTGFKEAFSKESFPIGSMDENTTHLLIGELARRVGEYSEAMRWISVLVTKQNLPKRIKERAIDIKDMIRAENRG